MAFLGSLGKSLGLSSSFGEGLVAGFATSVDKGIQEDMKRTQDNVDNLVIETYKGAVEGKKEFDKMYKENKKLVENIAANMGGDQGINHPQALQAAQTLINMKGLDGAFTEAQNYAKVYKHYGKHPTKSFLDQETSKPSGITLSALTKSTVPPISIPDTSVLGEAANVGFMKMNFFGGKSTAGSEITNRAAALIKARGIDVNEQTVELPPALKGKIDPLILGIKDNPVEEKARLLMLRANAERDGTLTPEMETNIKEMIDITEGIVNSLKTKKGLDYLTLERVSEKTQSTLAGMYQIKQSKNQFGVYEYQYTGMQQKALLNKTSEYYTNLINEATYNGGDLQNGNENFRKIKSAILNNHAAVGVFINGEYTIQVDRKSKYLDLEDKKLLNPKSVETQGVLDGNKKTKTLDLGDANSFITEYKEAKKRYPDLDDGITLKIERNFINSYILQEKEKGNLVTLPQAQSIFRERIKQG